MLRNDVFPDAWRPTTVISADLEKKILNWIEEFGQEGLETRLTRWAKKWGRLWTWTLKTVTWPFLLGWAPWTMLARDFASVQDARLSQKSFLCGLWPGFSALHTQNATSFPGFLMRLCPRLGWAAWCIPSYSLRFDMSIHWITLRSICLPNRWESISSETPLHGMWAQW